MSAVVCNQVIPLNDGVVVTEMNFDQQTTDTGIIIGSDDGKSEGIKPRWGKVFAIGKDQHDVKVGDWILVDHGRWTRSIDVKIDDHIYTIRRVETKSILLKSDQKPQDVYLGQSNSSTSQSYDFNIPTF